MATTDNASTWSLSHALLPPISFITCLSILILQSIALLNYWKKYASNADTIFVMIVVMSCYLFNTLQSFIGCLLETALPTCNVCNWAPLLTQLLYATTRFVSYLFYLQRARLAQSFKPVIPNFCFNKLFPVIFIIIWLSVIALYSITGAGDKSDCVDIPSGQGPSFISNKWCYINTPSHGRYINIGAILELIVTLFFGYLFVQPLIRLIISNEKHLKLERTYTQDRSGRLSILDSIRNINPPFSSPSQQKLIMSSGTGKYTPSTQDRNKSGHSIISSPNLISNNTNNTISSSPSRIHENDTRYIQTQELKRALWYNVTLSILSLSACILTTLIWPINPRKLFWIPYTDYMTNTITTFFILGRNRKYIHKLCQKPRNACYKLFCLLCCHCWCCHYYDYGQINDMDHGRGHRQSSQIFTSSMNGNMFTLTENGGNTVTVNTLYENNHSNNILVSGDENNDSDESVLSATAELLLQQQKYFNFSPENNRAIPNYQATESNITS